MKPSSASLNSGTGLSAGQLALGVFGLVAPIVTFLLATSPLPDAAKIFFLVVLALGYACVCLWSFQKSHVAGRATLSDTTAPVADDLQQALHAIGEASEFFGSSLKPSDLFRLVSSRVGHVFPFAGSALFVQGEKSDSLEIVQTDGCNSEMLLNTVLPVEKGLAGMSWLSGEVETDA